MPRKVRRKTRKRKSLYKKRPKIRKRRKTRKRKVTKRRRRRRNRQRGGGTLGNCQNPFSGGKVVPYEPAGMDLRRGILTRQEVGYKPQQGGGSLFRNLGFTFPKDLYHDSKDFLMNVKHSYMGDRQDSTSNVMNQPIGKMQVIPHAPTDYSKAFIEADAAVAAKMKSLS